MKLWLDKNTFIDTANGIDISIPLVAGPNNVNAWYCDPVKIEPVVGEGFIGAVKQGGAVNFNNVMLNPHGNGTHTECVGHISKEFYSINDVLKQFHFDAHVITVQPKKVFNEQYQEDDLVIDKASILECELDISHLDALVIRTLTNSTEKKTHQYSNTNPPYFTACAMQYIVDSGIKHLLVDLPSVDREVDGGELNAHRIFWNYPTNPSLTKTITELIYVPNSVSDGNYHLEFQIISIMNDASPSKIMLYNKVAE